MGAVLLERHRNQVSRPCLSPYTELQAPVQMVQLSYSCSRPPGYLPGFLLKPRVQGLLATITGVGRSQHTDHR